MIPLILTGLGLVALITKDSAPKPRAWRVFAYVRNIPQSDAGDQELAYMVAKAVSGKVASVVKVERPYFGHFFVDLNVNGPKPKLGRVTLPDGGTVTVEEVL